MKGIWTEAKIRSEMQKLDKITNLSGSRLPISFTDSCSFLGRFYFKNMRFEFSRKWFHDPEWSTQSALDVIRHEYAHYMNKVIYGGTGHDRTWRACCTKVGAQPSRLYNGQLEKYFQSKAIQQKATIAEFSTYRIGDIVKHPVYKTGKIISFQGYDIGKTVTIEFDGMVKTFTMEWISKNCNKG